MSALATAALNGFPVPLLKLDATGHVLGHNAAWEALMGATLPGADLATQVHPEDHEAWREALRSSRTQTDAPGPRRLRFVHPLGGLRWFDVSLGRTELGFDMAACDATALQRQETALQVAAHSARSLLDGVPALIYRGRNDRDWTMEVLSQGCLELTGYPASQLIDGREIMYSSLIAPEDAEYVWDTVQTALREHRPYSLCYRIRCAGGQTKCILEKGQGVYAANGEILGIEGVVLEPGQDIVARLHGLHAADAV